jgi:hypothetical protein
MNVYLLYRVEEGTDSRMGYMTNEDVLEGVYATHKAAKDGAGKGMGIVLSSNIYRIERRKVKE